jgi:hypothetical protein
MGVVFFVMAIVWMSAVAVFGFFAKILSDP